MEIKLDQVLMSNIQVPKPNMDRVTPDEIFSNINALGNMNYYGNRA